MPIGAFVNAIPAPIFIANPLGRGSHRRLPRATLVCGGRDGLRPRLWALRAGGLSYPTDHLDWTVFLFAHTVSEVLDLLAFILIFAGAAKRVLRTPAGAGVQ